MLNARGLRLAYGRRTVIPGIDLALTEGACVALAGPNGSGKSTLLRGLARLIRPAAGGVLLDGRELAAWPPRALARRMAILPQSPESPRDLTVAQLVALGRYPHQAFAGLASARDREAIQAALEHTDLTALASRPLAALSGGERQRAWIALTLAQEPRILLLDEPTSFLDMAHGLSVLELVRRLNRERGLTVVMALHDLSQAARFADRLILLRAGQVVADGAPLDVLTPPTIAAVFDVEATIIASREGWPVVIPTRVLHRGPAGSDHSSSPAEMYDAVPRD